MPIKVLVLVLAILCLVVSCTSIEENDGLVEMNESPREYVGESIDLSFPFRDGDFYITQGGSTRESNYHYWHPLFRNEGMHVSVRYAVDINKMGAGGPGRHVDNPQSLEDYTMYGEPLYSPCDGIVYYLQDGHPDMPAGSHDMENPRGNHIVIRHDGIHIAMLHLMPGTVQVSIGEEVVKGQLLGKIGNSGLTSSPHLHIQAARGNTWFGEAVPILFDGEFLIRGDVVSIEP